MVYCAQAELAFSSGARRNAVLSDIQTRVLGKPRWGAEAELLRAKVLKQGANGIQACLWFTSRADADDLLARIVSFATGVRLPLAGSWVRLHNCAHDEPDHAGCVVDAEQVW